MTIATLVGLAIARRIGLTQRILAANEARAAGLGDVKQLARHHCGGLRGNRARDHGGAFPALSDVGLWLRDAPPGYAAFYAVRSFNNCGFSPDPVGSIRIGGDLWMLFPIGLGVLIGARGFSRVLQPVAAWRIPGDGRSTPRCPVDDRGAVVVSAALLLLFEWSNPTLLAAGHHAQTIGNVVLPVDKSTIGRLRLV